MGLDYLKMAAEAFRGITHTHTVYVCSSAIPHLSVQFLRSLADAIKYILEWAAAVCTAVPHLSVQFVLCLDHFSVPSVLPRRDRFDHFNTALS